MITIIKRWFAASVFENDEEKTHRASLLNVGTVTSIIFSSLVILGDLIGGKTPVNTLLIDILVLIIALLLLGLLRRGKIDIAAFWLFILGYILTTGAVASLGTIRTPTTTVYILLIIMTGAIFNLSGILFATISSSLAVGGLILAENAGMLPPADYTVTITQWVTFTALFGLTAGMSYSTSQIIRKALLKAKREIKERDHMAVELNKLRQAVEQSPVSILIADINGSIEYVNPRFTQVTGYQFEEAIGKNPRILKTDLTPQETHQQLWDTVTAGNEWHGEFVNRKKNGTLYYESAIIAPITDLDGVTTHYVAVKEDVTERKQTEQSLLEMQSRLHLLSDNLEEAALYVYSHDARGQPHFEYVSAGMEKLTGVKSDDILQDASTLLSLILPEYLPQLAELEAKSKEDLKSFEMEVRERHALTGNIHWTLLRSTPRRRTDGSTVWYGVQIDITERKRSEKLLESANKQLHNQLTEIEQLQVDLREQALHDPLTGLYNRRYLSETLKREIVRASREHTHLSVIISDIDHFKKINDTYGHQVGDTFLVEIASLVKKHSRGSDIICRYGGEEFLLVLPGTTLDSATKRAEEIRQKCKQIIIQHEEKELKTTMSFGIASYPEHGNEAEEIILKADQAMYRSKRSGRNRVTAWEDKVTD